ncbi:AAC(3) family N-acetyltransferase [Halobaculum magnesiiphilum]|uniref:AAC(3) family N-acetyltransferase n=2 Tax=Halobaculum magnesiiphilum TaxID=1017351 RepID=A0A8T8WD05_9EURY|nr:AAC(3) family N-acetyltransferase [Halobaculum magnesiiphilum]QZP37643.1 AAC(3) family N-acetyltransferase [Halobaculum magnesiiphilum]
MRDTSASPFPFAEFRSILSEYDDPVVFVHIGLSDVNAAFAGCPYERLCSALTAEFESVLVPGFTPSFRESGVYHKEYSRPQVGAFPVLFMDDAEYRTNDALHSIQVAGEYRFDGCTHQNTFGPDGCYARLDEDNVLIANIGTNRLVSTQFHYISLRDDPPYQTTDTHSGVIYYDESTHQRVSQTNDTFESIYTWNRWKIERYLDEQGVLDDRTRNGLKLSFARAGDMREALEPKLERDPYYMVT